MKGRSLLVVLLLLVCMLTRIEAANRAAATTGQFANPILASNNADPSVAYKDGWYYSAPGDTVNIVILKSPTLEGLNYAIARKVVFTGGTDYAEIWSPELQYLNGNWYIYASAKDASGFRRLFTLKADTQDPLGTWTNLGRLTPSSNLYGHEVDTSILQKTDGSLYALFAGHPAGGNNGNSVLYINAMSNPSTLSGTAVIIAQPTLSWEGAVVEAPAWVIKNGKINVAYSANDYQTTNYALGLLTNTDGNVMNPSSWTKNSTPIFATGSTNVWGPGSNSFVKSPDGTEDWNVYHAKDYAGAGYHRHINTQKFTWNADNTPNLGTPIGIGTLQNRPSGEIDAPLPSPIYYDAEYQTVNHAIVYSDNAAWSTAYVGGIDFTDSYVQFNRVNVPTAGTYKLVIRYGNGGLNATHKVSINGGSETSVTLNSTGGWNTFALKTIDVTLAAGDNTIKFRKGTRYATLDTIFVPRAEGEFAKLIGGSVVTARSNAQLGYDVGNINWPTDCVSFENQVLVPSLTGGVFTLRARYSAGWGAATDAVTVNGVPAGTISFAGTTDWNTFSTATASVTLNLGWNTIQFCKSSNYAEIDSIEWY